MATYQGTFYAVIFKILDRDGNPVNLTGWTFRAMIRVTVEDTDPLLELTTANGGFLIVDAANGRVQMQILAAQTDDLPEGRLVFDVERTDLSPGPIWEFGGRIKVKQPVTRDG